MEPKCDTRVGSASDRQPLFMAAEKPVVQLSLDDAPLLQRLLERCGDFYDLTEGRAAEPDAAISELTDGPAERVPHDLFALGILEAEQLVGTIGALRHHRRPNQWYVGLMLLDPAARNQGFGRAAYEAFEQWIIGQDADSILLAVVEANVAAARFWQSVGFGWPRCYPERTIGLKRHVLIEFEKSLGC